MAGWLQRADPPRSDRATSTLAVVGAPAWHLRVGGSSNLHGMDHQVVRRPPGQKGFAALPRRWIIERSFAWLTPWGGLLRDRAGRLDVSNARLHAALVPAATEALINPA